MHFRDCESKAQISPWFQGCLTRSGFSELDSSFLEPSCRLGQGFGFFQDRKAKRRPELEAERTDQNRNCQAAVGKQVVSVTGCSSGPGRLVWIQMPGAVLGQVLSG